MKNIYLIVAPSGAGKTTIANILEENYGLKSIQSYTTRSPRYEGETGHIFVSDEEFDKLTDIVAYTEFCGSRYCATAEQVEENDLYVIDPKGVDFFRENYNGSKQIMVIYIDTDTTTRYERMKQRAIDSGSDYLPAVDGALKRISNDVAEFYDYIHRNVSVDYTADNGEGADVNIVTRRIYEYIQGEENDNEGNKA